MRHIPFAPILFVLIAQFASVAASPSAHALPPIEEVEARCEAKIYGETVNYPTQLRKRTVVPGWQNLTVSRFVAVVMDQGRWCVQGNDFDQRNGYTQYLLSADEMKQAFDDYQAECTRINTPPPCDRPANQCQQYAQQQCQQPRIWSPYARERAYGIYACASDFPSLLKAMFPFDTCTVNTVGPKNRLAHP